MQEFFNKCDGWNNYYSTVTIIGSTLEKVMKVLQKMYDSKADCHCYNGGVFENGVISFDVYKEYPGLLARKLSKHLPDAVIYADISWDDHEFYACKNSSRYNGFTARWEKEEPEGYQEDDEENETYYDCDVIIKDNVTGHEFFIGGGMCTQEEFEMYKALIEKGARTKDMMSILSHLYREGSALLSAASQKESLTGAESAVLDELANFCQVCKNCFGTPTDDLELYNIVHISTAHISKKTADMLEQEGVTNGLGISVYEKLGYGWFIYVPTGDITESSLPEDLKACLLFAQNMGCAWLCLDRDAEMVDGLSIYEW